MNSLFYVKHYRHIDTTNTTVIALKKETFERLLESRKGRAALGGDYKHNNSLTVYMKVLMHKYMGTTDNAIRSTLM